MRQNLFLLQRGQDIGILNLQGAAENNAGADGTGNRHAHYHRAHLGLDLSLRDSHSSHDIHLVQGLQDTVKYTHFLRLVRKSLCWCRFSYRRLCPFQCQWAVVSVSSIPLGNVRVILLRNIVKLTRNRFMQSDPFWGCAMAINVYLVFFHRYDADRLRRLHWVYGILCYGLPFLPAIVGLLYRTRDGGRMYGNSTVSPVPVRA